MATGLVIQVFLSTRHTWTGHNTTQPSFLPRNLEPLVPIPSTFKRKPQTTNPRPQTPNTSPHTQNPNHQTPNPEPQPQNPKPPSSDPKPQTPSPEAGIRGRSRLLLHGERRPLVRHAGLGRQVHLQGFVVHKQPPPPEDPTVGPCLVF